MLLFLGVLACLAWLNGHLMVVNFQEVRARLKLLQDIKRLLAIFVLGFLVLIFILRGRGLFVGGFAFLLFLLLLFHLLSDRDQSIETINRYFELLVKNYLIDVAFLRFRNVLYYSRVVV